MREKKKIIFIITMMIFALSLISIGVFFNYLAQPQNIVSEVIDNGDFLVKNFFEQTGEYLNLGDNFSVDSRIKTTISSEYYTNDNLSNLESLKKVNLLKNISNLNTEVIIKHDKNNKKAYLELLEKLGEEDFIHLKYLIDNSTEYFFVNDFVNNYVNNGSCNYFEMFDEKNSSKDNINYLYDFIIESLKSNLKNEYFKRYVVQKNINGIEKNVNQISIRITDKLIKKILKDIFNDLDEDERANKILTSVNENFFKLKIDEDKEIIDSNASYTINIYTSKYLMKPLKIEVIYLNGNDKRTITYEGDLYTGSIYYIKGDEVIYDIDAKFENKVYKLNIKNSANEKVGGLKLEFDKERIDLSFDLDNDLEKMNVVYLSKFDNSLKSKLKRQEKLNFKIKENNISKYDLEFTIDSDFSKDVQIKEDISKAILETTLNDDTRTSLKNKRTLLKERLER